MRKNLTTSNLLILAGWTAIGGAQPSFALGPENCNPNCPNSFTESPVSEGCGKVGGAGATLFSDFFRAPASTNDFIDVDGDGCFQFDATPTPPCNFVDQLAGGFTTPVYTGCWLFNYRSVGSVNGVREFITFQCTGDINTSIPGEGGLLNRAEYAVGGNCVGGFNTCNASCTPICLDSIDFSLADVPGIWSTRPVDTTGSAWNRAPGLTGYGFNPIPSSTGFSLSLPTLDCLNTNTVAPDEMTIYETQVAWGPIGYIANRRSGVRRLDMTDIQHLMVTGRLRNGENLVGSTRSAGSGTRNGMMNTSGIDPTWGRGDNVGNESPLDDSFRLGPNTQPTNAEGSGQIEIAIQNWGLSVGYTGLAGGSRAVADARAGRYEIIDVKFDDRGGSSFVRPSVDAVVDNCDVNAGWQLGGAVTFTTRGNPEETSQASPAYMEARPAAAYLNNIRESIEAFISVPGLPADQNMPGEFLATTFFILAGVDCQGQLSNPIHFVASAGFNQSLQDYIRDNNTFGVSGVTPANAVAPYGAINPAGLVPQRKALTLPATYSDGSSTGQYANFSGALTINSGLRLSARNDLMGDFNNDNVRDINDIDDLVAAVANPRAFVSAEGIQPGDAGQIPDGNYVMPEVIGDYNGDGNLTAADVRYHADGLALVPGARGVGLQLNRKLGFIAVDTAAQAQFGNPNYFNTTLAHGTYSLGDSRADVAGSATGPIAGFAPTGADGVVDCDDIDYICAHFADWTNLNQAVFSDLSCDMNGDLLVNNADIDEVLAILETTRGDLDLDGDEDAADLAIAQANLGQTGVGYCGGDVNCDGIVDAADLALIGGPNCGVCGDSNCDNAVTVSDIGYFVTAVAQGQAAWDALGGTTCDFICANDTNGDNAVTVGDIGLFVAVVTGSGSCQ